ncbi:MAG: rRNA maturation RNase YbeY [Anaerostipes sp.]|nr:rRNA maturation RNase YbeY [Anaerostipes sp.]
MNIYIENEYLDPVSIDYKKITDDVVNASLDFLQCPYEVEVNVMLVDNPAIHQINLEQRGINRPTDVLSFPMIEFKTPGDFSVVDDDITLFHPDTGEILLGDIVISMDKVKEQAKLYGHSSVREFAFLVAHSMLHLCGYDHEEENERIEMEKMQNEILLIANYTRD